MYEVHSEIINRNIGSETIQTLAASSWGTIMEYNFSATCLVVIFVCKSFTGIKGNWRLSLINVKSCIIYLQNTNTRIHSKVCAREFHPPSNLQQYTHTATPNSYIERFESHASMLDVSLWFELARVSSAFRRRSVNQRRQHHVLGNGRRRGREKRHKKVNFVDQSTQMWTQKALHNKCTTSSGVL